MLGAYYFVNKANEFHIWMSYTRAAHLTCCIFTWQVGWIWSNRNTKMSMNNDNNKNEDCECNFFFFSKFQFTFHEVYKLRDAKACTTFIWLPTSTNNNSLNYECFDFFLLFSIFSYEKNKNTAHNYFEFILKCENKANEYIKKMRKDKKPWWLNFIVSTNLSIVDNIFSFSKQISSKCLI